MKNIKNGKKIDSLFKLTKMIVIFGARKGMKIKQKKNLQGVRSLQSTLKKNQKVGRKSLNMKNNKKTVKLSKSKCNCKEINLFSKTYEVFYHQEKIKTFQK
jgi:translation elongation factor P/translation initiation factor 5A